MFKLKSAPCKYLALLLILVPLFTSFVQFGTSNNKRFNEVPKILKYEKI